MECCVKCGAEDLHGVGNGNTSPPQHSPSEFCWLVKPREDRGDVSTGLVCEGRAAQWTCEKAREALGRAEG